MENSTKDYIINIRVSRHTYDKIKSMAKKNGQSVSHIIRSVLNDSAEIISDLAYDFGLKNKDKFSKIASYHKAVLAKNRTCDNCGSEMVRGQVVTVGETANGAVYYFCPKCK